MQKVPLGHNLLTGELGVSYLEEPLDRMGLESQIASYFTSVNESRRENNQREFTNGPLLGFNYDFATIDDSGNISIPMQLGDYSTFVYLDNHKAALTTLPFASLATVAYLVTKEGDLVFSVASRDTYDSGNIGSSAGGAVSLDDVTGANVLLLPHMRNEIGEELNVPVQDVPDLKLYSTFMYLEKESFTAHYFGVLNLSNGEVNDAFATGKSGEHKELIFVPADKVSLTRFYSRNPDRLLPFMQGATDNLFNANLL